jgi:hypothetical protein
MIARAPNGKAIIARLDEIPVYEFIVPGSFRKDERGRIEWDWKEERKVVYDDQVPVMNDKMQTFVDEDHRYWYEEDLTIEEA